MKDSMKRLYGIIGKIIIILHVLLCKINIISKASKRLLNADCKIK